MSEYCTSLLQSCFWLTDIALHRMAARSSEMYGVDGAEEGGPGDQKASLEDVLREQEPSQGEEAEEMVDGTYEYAYRAAPHRARGGHGTGYGAGAYYAGGGDFNGSDYVMVDAHVLASPVLADINGDGHMEVRPATPNPRWLSWR